jgi:putative hemolysin
MAVEIVAEKFIDLKKLIESKNPTLAKWLPSPILNWIRKIIHEKDANRFIAQNGHLRNLEFVAAVMEELQITIRVTGLENIPTSGGCIVAANHPLGGVDGVALMQAVGSKRADIRFFVNDLLLYMTGFGELFVGVNKHGTNPREALKLMDSIFGSDKCILFFPAGLVSRRQNGIIRDLDWQKSFIAKAVQHQKPIVPTFIGGKNSDFFYNLANWRKKLGIKANLEMFFLVQEMYKQKGNTIDFHFGKPIEPTVFTKEKTTTEWAAWLKSEIYSMEKKDING